MSADIIRSSRAGEPNGPCCAHLRVICHRKGCRDHWHCADCDTEFAPLSTLARLTEERDAVTASRDNYFRVSNDLQRCVSDLETQLRVERTLHDSREKMRPQIEALLEGENVSAEIMDMRLRSLTEERAAATTRIEELRGGPDGPFEKCHDCGRAMVWDNPDREMPTWMCPRCVLSNLNASRAAATTGEPVAWALHWPNGRVTHSGSSPLTTQDLAAHRPEATVIPLYAAPAPQVAALTEERDRPFDGTATMQAFGRFYDAALEFARHPSGNLAAVGKFADAKAEFVAQLEGNLRIAASLSAALERITERSSYPIDPRDAFEEALDRARVALPTGDAPR